MTKRRAAIPPIPKRNGLPAAFGEFDFGFWMVIERSRDLDFGLGVNCVNQASR